MDECGFTYLTDKNYCIKCDKSYLLTVPFLSSFFHFLFLFFGGFFAFFCWGFYILVLGFVTSNLPLDEEKRTVVALHLIKVTTQYIPRAMWIGYSRKNPNKRQGVWGHGISRGIEKRGTCRSSWGQLKKKHNFQECSQKTQVEWDSCNWKNVWFASPNCPKDIFQIFWNFCRKFIEW